jgi:hypothetical protein
LAVMEPNYDAIRRELCSRGLEGLAPDVHVSAVASSTSEPGLWTAVKRISEVAARLLTKPRGKPRKAPPARFISWRALADISVEEQAMLGPARLCQWIEDGCFCNAPSVPGRSWCAEHAARVFVAVEVG